MRWAVLLLLSANLALAGYLVFIDRSAAPAADVRRLEMNADKLRLLKSAAGKADGRACLEWSNLSTADLARAQEQLVKLNPGKTSVRERAIIIVEPSPALVARVAELKAGFAGTELKAVVCPVGAA